VDLFLEVLPRAVAAVRSQLDPPTAGPVADGTLVLDTLGRRCPIPVIELAKHFAEVAVGGLVAVLSDDEAARLDIPAWCEMRGQEYVGEAPAEDFPVTGKAPAGAPVTGAPPVGAPADRAPVVGAPAVGAPAAGGRAYLVRRLG
jgi:cysteine desulfurase